MGTSRYNHYKERTIIDSLRKKYNHYLLDFYDIKFVLNDKFLSFDNILINNDDIYFIFRINEDETLPILKRNLDIDMFVNFIYQKFDYKFNNIHYFCIYNKEYNSLEKIDENYIEYSEIPVKFKALMEEKTNKNNKLLTKIKQYFQKNNEIDKEDKYEKLFFNLENTLKKQKHYGLSPLNIEDKLFYVRTSGLDTKQPHHIRRDLKNFTKIILNPLGYNIVFEDFDDKMIKLENINMDSISEILGNKVPKPCIFFIYLLFNEDTQREITTLQYTITHLREDLITEGINVDSIKNVKNLYE